MKKVFAVLLAACCCLLGFIGCANLPKENDIAGKAYVYEGEGADGKFTIEIYDDGTYSYYEGLYRNYIGMGTWTLNGDILCLTEDEKAGTSFVNYFKVEGNELIFLSEDSSNFLIVDVEDGDGFIYREQLTLEKVIELSKKGEELTWSDFEQYSYKDIGCGLYIYRYDIDEDYYLLIKGFPQISPGRIHLVSKADKDKYIDIRTESVEDFIEACGG